MRPPRLVSSPFAAEHAVHVVRLGLRADHDDRALGVLRPALGDVGIERDDTHGGAGRDVQATGEPISSPHCLLYRASFQLRVQEEIDLVGRDAQQRLFAGDQALLDHVHGDAHGGLGGALGVAGLQHPELAAFDSELDVLQVAIVVLELRGDRLELGVGRRHLEAQLVDRLGHPDAGDHVFALGVGEVVALDSRRAGRPAARHRDAGRRVVAEVAEDHRADVHRRAEIVRDVGGVAIVDGAASVPAAEDRLGGEPDLLARVLRKGTSRLALDDLLEPGGNPPPVVGSEVGVARDPGALPGLRQHLLERFVGDLHHHRAEHLHQPAVAVEGEARIAGETLESRRDLVVEADVEHRVHHAGHREARSRAAGDEQRIRDVAEALAGHLLEAREGREHLVPEAVGESLAALEIGVAAGRRDGEPGRDRKPQPCHVGQIRALAAEQAAHRLPVSGDPLRCRQFVEAEDPLVAHRALPSAKRSEPPSRPLRDDAEHPIAAAA